MSHNFLLRLFIRAPDERFWDPGFKFVHSVYTIFALFFVSTDLLQLAYTCQFFSLCPTLDTSGVFRQYPHCLPVCVVFVHLSVDILLIVGQFYNIEKRNRQHSATIQSNEISMQHYLLLNLFCSISIPYPSGNHKNPYWDFLSLHFFSCSFCQDQNEIVLSTGVE